MKTTRIMSATIQKLFQPIRVGAANLQQRVLLAFMTRCHADAQHVPGGFAAEYYR
jgi:2,4-dienoyl-CoA reductase-like NADH-dependent reductase (Old Yellow Enzyme family)